MSNPLFKGTDDQQALAAEIFRLMTTQGALFAADAPIKQTLGNLADFLAAQKQRDRDVIAEEIDSALQENNQVFLREEQNGEILYVTSRLGKYVPYQEDTRHMFKERLYEPENPLPIDDISVVVSTSRPALTTVEPVFISDYWQRQAGLTPVSPETLRQPTPAEAEPAVVAAVPPVEAAPATIAEEPVIEAVPAEVAPPEEVVAVPAAPEPVEQPVSRFAFTLPDGTRIDLAQPPATLVAEHGSALAKALIERIDQDPLRRIVSFGRSIYPEASVVSLGKNDMRRIRDYILEVGEPLLDTTIIADLYYHNPRQSDYEGFRFSLNYRLSREKDFEFVGVEGARLWSTRGLPMIGTKRVKASEIGQLTAYLTEGYDDSLELQSADSIKQSGTVTRLLTFFEWEYGILPLDASLTTLLPKPLLPDQRSAVLRFESPQHYSSYLVEVRYPTGNRGGWLQGLEDFFREHLVPGALVTIGRTDDSNIFTISYAEASESQDRLLTLDEKKNKFAFANLSFYCAVDNDWLLNQQRFGKLKNLKALPMSDRRKGDVVLAHVFETAGEQMGRRDEPRYWMSLDDLTVAYNVLRPTSKSYLRTLLEEDEAYTLDQSTPGAYYYTPAPKPASDDDDDDDVGTRGRYDDDE